MINSISLNQKYNVSFYKNQTATQQPITRQKLDASIYSAKSANSVPFARNYNVSFSGNKTYITGHHNPDTDSICSAIGVAYLANQMKKTDKEYKAISPGEIGPEAQYILEEFGVEKPEKKEDITLTVKEAMTQKPLKDISIKQNASIREFCDLIMAKDLKTAPVLDDDGNLTGIISRKTLAEFIIRPTDYLRELKQHDIPYSKIAEILKADVLTGGLSIEETTVKGDIITATYSNDAITKHIDLKDGIVIVGDRISTQELAIKKGAKALIIPHKCTVPPHIIKQAKENNVIILSTELGNSEITNLLVQATPVSKVMSKEVVEFDANQTVGDAAETLKKYKFGFFPVTENGKFLGLISREEVLAPDHNGVILVDHGSIGQSVKGVTSKDIEGIIDHHQNETSFDRRVDTLFKCTGATATLVAREFKINDVPIPKDIAGILWGAIISDTDKFTSVTTTDDDKKMAKMLAKIAEIKQPDVLADQILAQRDKHLINASAKTICTDDLKQFSTQSGKQFCIAQIKTAQSEEYLSRREEIEEALNKIDNKNKTNGSVLMITDQLQGATYLISSNKMKNNAKNLADSENEAFLKNNIYKSSTSHREIIRNMLCDKSSPRLSNVQSRKEQVQPFIYKLVELGNKEEE